MSLEPGELTELLCAWNGGEWQRVLLEDALASLEAKGVDVLDLVGRSRPWPSSMRARRAWWTCASSPA